MCRVSLSSALLGAVTLIGAALSSAPNAQAQAVIYCTGPGVPDGCVVRPAAPAR